MTDKKRPDFYWEDAYAQKGLICGVDEAGRGPWAGPVVAAAVILDRHRFPEGIADSKQLTHRQRERICAALKADAVWAIGAASVREIDRINILHASELAMRRAVAKLRTPASLALIDGPRIPPDLPCEAVPLVKGDSRSLSVAAASIVAKVTRDELMARIGARYPDYGWQRNKGYGVPEHRRALNKNGPTRHHRRSFAPIARLSLPLE